MKHLSLRGGRAVVSASLFLALSLHPVQAEESGSRSAGESLARTHAYAQEKVQRGIDALLKRRQSQAEEADQTYANFNEEVCDQVDTDVDLESNPFVYTNPDAGCDIGLSMPGLPSLGSLGVGSLDSCKLLKAVTGDLVDDINRQMQGAVDDALAGVTEGAMTDFNVDLGDVAEDSLGLDTDVSSGRETGVDLNDIAR